MRTIAQTIGQLHRPTIPELQAPTYSPPTGFDGYAKVGRRVGLAVESMRDHMTSEGWELFDGLKHAGYILQGHNLPFGRVHVPQILLDIDPGTIVMQDKREWEGLTADRSMDPRIKFTGVQELRNRHDVFKLTVLKDAQQQTDYHRNSAEEIGCHAWIIYYNPDIVNHIAPYTRRQHLIRTYHSVDTDIVPAFDYRVRGGCLLSGAISGAYPLRKRLVAEVGLLPETEYIKHPGYHRSGCATPGFLRLLSRFKVAICTSSIYGYCLRKLIEATACGCVVISDLPTDEVLPYIDDNIIRVGPDKRTVMMGELVREKISTYDPEKQRHFSDLAKRYYDFRVLGRKLADDIEEMRRSYA